MLVSLLAGSERQKNCSNSDLRLEGFLDVTDLAMISRGAKLILHSNRRSPAVSTAASGA